MNNETYMGTDELLNARQVKRVLNTSLPWIYKAAAQGLIPCVRIPCPGKGKKKSRTIIRFKKKDLFDFVEKHYKQ